MSGFVGRDHERRVHPRITLREEILRLVAHGVLHLCGYDHGRAADAAAMKKREDEYLGRMTSHV